MLFKSYAYYTLRWLFQLYYMSKDLFYIIFIFSFTLMKLTNNSSRSVCWYYYVLDLVFGLSVPLCVPF